MLKKIRLTDFKSFVDEEVELAPLTLLVGANASGKSNFLDAIRILQGLSLGLEVAQILEGEENSRPDAWPGLRGRTQEAPRSGTSAFAIESTWIDQSASKSDFQHHLKCAIEPSEWVSTELRAVPGKVLEYEEGTRIQQSYFEKILFLRIEPDRMRDYGRRKAPLGEGGRNLSGVLADLCAEPETKRSLVDWLIELCAPELEDLDFVEVKELRDVMAIFVEKGGRRISARSISDGTLRFLGTLLALRTAESGSVVLIEDIESGLHPTRIRLLVDFLNRVADARQIQIIATTHSPVVLQWLSDDALRNVVAFGRVSDHEGTLMRRLGDLPHFDEAMARAGIEELFTTGWLEMAL
jgi:predicted ATPase